MNTQLTVEHILEAQTIMKAIPGNVTMRVAEPTIIELIEQQHRERRIIRQLNEKHK